MEGPEEKVLDPIIKRALLPLIAMMEDSSLHVKDSTAYTLGRITEACPSAIDASTHLEPLIQSLFNGLTNYPKMAASCCWALMNLAERFAGEPGAQTNPLTPHFNNSVTHLLNLSARNDCDSATRTAVYEVLNVFVQNAANESLQAVASLSDVILKRLEETVPMQTQVVSVEDKITLSDMQTSLSSVLQAIILRLDNEIAPQGDRIMQVLLQILSTVGGKSSVPEAVFAAISALATAVGEDFLKYMEAFSPFLYSALGNQDEPGLCSMAIGLVSDITRSLGERSQPYCDNFMNYLLNNLRVCRLSQLSHAPRLLTFFFSLMNRAPAFRTSSSLRFSNVLVISPSPSRATSRPTCPLSPKSSSRRRALLPLPMARTRCSTTSSPYARVLWTLGAALSLL